MKRREKLIRDHLKGMEEAKKRLPEKYHPIAGVTIITYGYFGRKVITTEEIENYKRDN